MAIHLQIIGDKKMSIFRCNYCDNLKDADIHGCMEDPRDDCECLCEDCHTELTGEEYV